MDQMKWKGLYSTGVEPIDRHNLHLFELLNHVHLRLSKKTRSKPKRIDLEEILRYAQFHFAREEVWMAHTHYPLLQAHEEEHKQLRQSLTAICISVQIDLASAREALGLLIDRLLHHIATWDAKFGSSESAVRLASYLRCNKTTPG